MDRPKRLMPFNWTFAANFDSHLYFLEADKVHYSQLEWAGEFFKKVNAAKNLRSVLYGGSKYFEGSGWVILLVNPQMSFGVSVTDESKANSYRRRHLSSEFSPLLN